MSAGDRALVTGITGQDGAYLSQLLLSKGYEVYGLVRGQNNPKIPLVQERVPGVQFVYGDLTDVSSIVSAIQQVQPDEVYNLGALSFVGASWQQPELTSNVTGLGALRVLEALRITKSAAKFYQASSSEMFGDVREIPQNEETPFYPRSPYGVAKAYAHYLTVNYRESYGIFACSGILFNHESQIRGKEFVTRKITDGVARIALGLSDHITLGNLDAKRDWGHAEDYVRAMYLMMQHYVPDDYVISTGELHSVREFVKAAFEVVGITSYEEFVRQDKRFVRPAEVNLLVGDSSKARQILGWQPTITFEQLVESMVENDIRELRKHL